MLNGEPFYWSTIRNLTSVFGTMFNDIKIVRRDSTDTEVDRFQVPIEYSAKMAWYQVAFNDAEASGSPNISTFLPRMSFKLDDMEYDAQRKTNTMNTLASDISGDGNTKGKTFAPVPYNFTYTLNVYSKYTEDGLQIVEQIIPYFSPSLNVKIRERTSPDVFNDVQITLQGITSEDNYLEQFETQRLQLWTFTFNVAANVYPPLTDTRVIRTSIVDIDNNAFDPAADLRTVTVAANPGELTDIDNSTVTITDE